ncbi:MAG: hypothetical protein GY807_12070, partial [Gammaproteobacteria bacterium]|nr:hypothetical protein [Gammaproteobacteria bacterium]
SNSCSKIDCPAFIHFCTSSSRSLRVKLEGLTSARQVKHIKKVEMVISDGHELVPLPEGNQYPGYIFAKADDSLTVIQALREAHACLNFVIDPVWRIV